MPEGPAELAACARDAAAAGAAMFHLHVRDADNHHSLDPGRYRETIAEIRATAGEEVVIQITTEAVGRYAPEAQIACVEAVRPEAVSLALRELASSSEDAVRLGRLHAWMDEAEIVAQHILYEPGEIARWRALRRQGLLGTAPPFLLFVLGRYEGSAAGPDRLLAFLDQLTPEDDAAWMVCAFGPAEAAAATLAAAHGGHARAGFENNLHASDGTLAASNAALLAPIADAACAAGRDLMSAAEFRTRFRAKAR